ncbi:DUF6510 family protein [Spirillospora sp. NPDC047279]|uniref:DUF6510 family protein n=1 Tax=Spirillospora sp. NPDC047279 TaxID=3155478 RepID=UPI003404555D
MAAERPITDDRHLDGNALAGPLSMLFVPDIATSTGRCGSCGRGDLLARAPLYAQAPGQVLRCRHCGNVVLRLVSAPDMFWLDLPHGSGLAIPHTAPADVSRDVSRGS